MAERDRPHILVPTPPASESFTPITTPVTSRGGGFSGSRSEHGKRLTQEFEAAWAPPVDEPETTGTYLTFASFPGLDLMFESLESRRPGAQPELVAVQQELTPAGEIANATVFIPEGQKEFFLKKLEQYVETAEVAEGKPKHAALIEGIASIRRATIRELWTDPADEYPTSPTESRWWELWLRALDGQEYARLTAYAQLHNLPVSDHYLGFGDRTVVLIRATSEQLAMTFRSIDDIAELRRPHEVASSLPGLSAFEQRDWVRELQSRVEHAGTDAPAVCLLDRGVQAGHPLLEDSLAADDLHAVEPSWRKDVAIHAHGTEMAGLALYGDLQAAVGAQHRIRLEHRLESVKLLPDTADNDPDVYGAVTARAVDQPEISAQNRARVFMLAITAPAAAPNPGHRVEDRPKQESGRPTAWSATLDALAFGRAIDDSAPKFTYLNRDEEPTPRLFVVSAGNIRDVRAEDNHLDRSDAEGVEDPAQSWNALAVGAYAEHDAMDHAPDVFAGYVPIAARGELSPTSRTSVSFDQKRWPFKPDVVAPGGNLARTPDGSGVDTPENLAILTTRLQHPGEGFFTTTRDTSAATAQVSAIAADILAAYPHLRPETVRALIVHSAEWTDAMQARITAARTKGAAVNLLRRYGMGVPSLERATRSATNALTLVDEAVIHPYERDGNSSSGKAREMNLHRLPWPIDELSALGETEVRLRVTLSYFVEPNPSSRGWTGRYVYPSHGLRFAMKRPEDNLDAFRQRVNKQARDEGEKPLALNTESGWLFGRDQQTSAGSLHTDIWLS
ncbi:type VII secretion-associated serine protease mycosin [Micrococcus luteus NCTC 2665]|uniref:Type VII secretion-associated serine protease mycosin n=1 Tax=Micrococcus luteus (strain ATCC 4698 / DSM 20030 / JCM 1464 / CCM 169 / CCUG 5858 / IAM 1056 / NBRC 3333 / NCIMB 9278 / NCTC 2665 / VKM Ac-2230) TaxID=465515 RepID=A0A7Z7KJJ9_MICLC|nr:S8 family peptidase [Micrococcus luteus]SQG49491.1 type VII secretion-associated serine protease mycosin [Micrococcus luteus NCTC 2665]